jgi:hypothetical protein
MVKSRVWVLKLEATVLGLPGCRKEADRRLPVKPAPRIARVLHRLSNGTPVLNVEDLELPRMIDGSHGSSDGSVTSCSHSGYYSGRGLYARESRVLRYVLVCDECGKEMQEISALDYVPQPLLAFT